MIKLKHANIKFDLEDKVIVIPLKLGGRVKAIEINRYGVLYLIAYLHESVMAEAWLHSEDLKAVA